MSYKRKVFSSSSSKTFYKNIKCGLKNILHTGSLTEPARTWSELVTSKVIRLVNFFPLNRHQGFAHDFGELAHQAGAMAETAVSKRAIESRARSV